MSEIPVLDLSQFTEGDAAARAGFVRDLGEAFGRIGFVAIRNHGFTAERREALYAAVRDFFALPDAKKAQCNHPDLAGQRGYTPPGREHAKGRTVADLKEFYQMGQPDAAADYPPNIWPEELPAFERECTATYQTLERAGRQLLRAIALHLNLPEDYFEPHATRGNSILRAIHYYPLADPDALPPDAVRAAAHGDINLITLLMGASAEGLQVQRRDGTWIDVVADPDQLVVNVGDMLDRLTNHALKSTIHRVANPPREKMNTSRYSIPFFLHPRAEMSLASLPQCVTADNPKRYPDATAGAFLDERLREIGLKK